VLDSLLSASFAVSFSIPCERKAYLTDGLECFSEAIAANSASIGKLDDFFAFLTRFGIYGH
jgi:hypothetical protein